MTEELLTVRASEVERIRALMRDGNIAMVNATLTVYKLISEKFELIDENRALKQKIESLEIIVRVKG